MDIRTTITDYLEFIENDALTPEARVAQLGLHLDRLALALHEVSFEFDETEYPDAPDTDLAALKTKLEQRFPTFGFYNIPERVTDHIADCGLTVGDALDDLLDITHELLDVEWCWANTSEANALWLLEHNYRAHWRWHLRGVQYYLEAVAHERGDPWS